MKVNMGPHHPSMHGIDKIAKNRTIIQYQPYVTHWDYLATINIQVSKKASYIRVIMLELSRITSLLYGLFLLWQILIDKCLDFCDNFLTGVTEYQKIEGVGIIGRDEIINWGLSRPMLQYEFYDKFDWKVQWQKAGDSLARYLVRIGEMTESIKIIQQGDLRIFLIRDQRVFPWRWKISLSGFINLQILPQLVKRMKLVDIMTILGSIDIIMGEVDR
ncbi:hypothetical protein UlMin_008855 [Ulmus minor]